MYIPPYSIFDKTMYNGLRGKTIEGDNFMNTTASQYQIWINWGQSDVSFHPIIGYDNLRFDTRETYDAEVQILLLAGFRFP